jgi:hypothetical protein
MASEMKFIAELPPGYDERVRMVLTEDNRVVVTHPEHPPLVLGPGGQWLDLNEALVHPAHSSSTC